MKPAPAPNSCAGIGRYTSSQEPYAPIIAWRRCGRGQGRVRGKLETVEGVGEDGRGGMKEADDRGLRISFPAWDGVISIRPEDQVQEPTPPAVADQPKTPETVALEMA